MKTIKAAFSITVVTAIVVPIFALAGCGASPEAADTLRKVRLATGYIPNVQFTNLYVAKAKGYYEEEGIDIEFDYGSESDLFKLLGADELQFIIGSGDQVIIARSQGVPVVYVAKWYSRYPVGVVALKEKDLDEPKKLEGHTVGIPGLFGASYVGWKAIVYAGGVDEEKVSLQSIGFVQVEAVDGGQVDAAVIYIANEPTQLRHAGHEVDVMQVSDYIDLVGNGLVTNEKTIKEDPELVRGMVRATVRGITYTIENPEESFEIAREFVPEITDEAAEVQRDVLDASISLWKGDTAPGLSDPQAWEASTTFMKEMGLVEGEVVVEELYTNEFVGGE